MTGIRDTRIITRITAAALAMKYEGWIHEACLLWRSSDLGAKLSARLWASLVGQAKEMVLQNNLYCSEQDTPASYLIFCFDSVEDLERDGDL